MRKRSNQSGWVTHECETCGHPVMSNQDHGWQRVMFGTCDDCPDCQEEIDKRGEEPVQPSWLRRLQAKDLTGQVTG